MKKIDERNLKIVCEPQYGTILYQDQKDTTTHYLAVLCGGIAQYERVVLINSEQFKELQLDDVYYLKRLAHDIAKGKDDLEEVNLDRSGTRSR
jgi:hypothetical protein